MHLLTTSSSPHLHHICVHLLCTLHSALPHSGISSAPLLRHPKQHLHLSSAQPLRICTSASQHICTCIITSSGTPQHHSTITITFAPLQLSNSAPLHSAPLTLCTCTKNLVCTTVASVPLHLLCTTSSPLHLCTSASLKHLSTCTCASTQPLHRSAPPSIH